MGFFGGLLGQNFFSLKRPKFLENLWLSGEDFPQLGLIHGDHLGTDPREKSRTKSPWLLAKS